MASDTVSSPSLWHQQNADSVLGELRVDADRGLDVAEAERRLAQAGANEIPDRSRRGALTVLGHQFASLMVLILIAAGSVSAALGDTPDAAAILAIVLLNALLGFRQECLAEQALAALRKLSRPAARVLRDGRVREVPSRDLVPGDIVLLEAGNVVSADGRLLEAIRLRSQESVLTGESEPVDKDAGLLLPGAAPLGDRRNMIYSGTLVTHGRGRAVITGTGIRTELGRIAELIRTAKRNKTPLELRLDQMSRRMATIALALVTLVFVLGVWRGTDLKRMFLTSVSLAVAAVPEGLPAVVTIALALGAQRMLRRNALVRNLSAVETLGSVTVICTDKTGTLTENRMRVTAAVAGGREFALGGAINSEAQDLLLLLAGGALCNDAHLEPSVGDPMEVALAEAAQEAGLETSQLDRLLPRVSEIPFDSQRKRMTTLHRLMAPQDRGSRDCFELLLSAGTFPLAYVAVTKGAVDGMLAVCDSAWREGRAEPLTQDQRKEILSTLDGLAERGLRVLGIAFRPLHAIDLDSGQVERDLIFIGMVGLTDPARPEVPAALEVCRRAGIRPIMITGDYPLTSRYVAEQVGLSRTARVLTGEQLVHLAASELDKAVQDASVFARVTPEHKLMIVESLQRQGHIVAMTGDGVNDAPALKKADIGVAMGRTGSDVARGAATIVLQDDNFATIVAAVEEGRVIFDNLRKFVRYMLASNSGEMWVMLLAPLIGMPLPLLPLQILWMNLVTDGLPALALALEPSEKDTMRRPPRRPDQGIFAGGLPWWILWVGCFLGTVALAGGYGLWHAGRDTWQTMLFTVLTLSQISLAFAVRSERESLFRQPFFSNQALLGASALTVVLQLAVVYAPAGRALFHTVALPPGELILCAALSTAVFWAVEAEKRFARRNRSKNRSMD
jgi:P-type Ca2+ transporter type 2C